MLPLATQLCFVFNHWMDFNKTFRKYLLDGLLQLTFAIILIQGGCHSQQKMFKNSFDSVSFTDIVQKLCVVLTLSFKTCILSTTSYMRSQHTFSGLTKTDFST